MEAYVDQLALRNQLALREHMLQTREPDLIRWFLSLYDIHDINSKMDEIQKNVASKHLKRFLRQMCDDLAKR